MTEATEPIIPRDIAPGIIRTNPRVFLKNNSGETMPPFALCRITGMSSFGDEQFWTVDKPDTSFQRWHLINGPLAVLTGRIGSGSIGPICQVYFDETEGTPGVGESWGAKSGQWSLVKDRPGFTITGVRSLSSQPIVEALQQPVDILTGKADSAITAGNTGTVSVHFSVSGTASEYNITGNYKWAEGGTIASGSEVLLNYVDGLWLIEPPGGSSTLTQRWSAATKASQSITASSSNTILQWDSSGSSGISRDTGNYKHVITEDGFYWFQLSFDAEATAGGSSAWDFISNIQVNSVFDALGGGSGSSTRLGIIDLDGTSTNRARRNFAALYGYNLVATDEIWHDVTELGGQNCQINNMYQRVWYCGGSVA